MDWPFKPLLVEASDVTITERDLRREDLEPFAPLLRSAQVVHVGKGTTMGLGMVWGEGSG